MADPKDPWRCQYCECSWSHVPYCRGWRARSDEECPGYETCTRPEKREKVKDETR